MATIPKTFQVYKQVVVYDAQNRVITVYPRLLEDDAIAWANRQQKKIDERGWNQTVRIED